MSEVRIAAEPRTEFGKGAARRVRRAGKVPAVLYGHGDAPRHVSLPGHELMLALKSDANVLLTLQTEQGDQLALPRAVVRDPIKGFLEHLDLVAVRRGEKVTVDIPVHVVGDAAPETLVVTDSRTWLVLGPSSDERTQVEWLHRRLLPAAVGGGAVSIAYHHSAEAALEAVGGGLAVLLPAPDFDQVQHTLSRGHLLPEKATSFQPKPSLGVLMRSLRDE